MNDIYVELQISSPNSSKIVSILIQNHKNYEKVHHEYFDFAKTMKNLGKKSDIQKSWKIGLSICNV